MSKSKDSGSSSSEPYRAPPAEKGPWRVPKGVEVTSLRGLLRAGDEVSPRDFPGKMVVLLDLLSKGKLEVF